ncbi:hypothetical protein WN944_011130 [Citrus x changshan-huyou]|uniref:Uncharacterized protein n=1 Tax=Citrus x changshan-huyou TaxID=2935761 RepID=A0AAP0MWC7_9ROSI
MCPSTTPIIVPLAYPARTIFQPNASTDSEGGSSSAGEASEFPHFLDKGSPHNPGFPANQSFVNRRRLFKPLLKELEETKIVPELYPCGSRGPVGAHYLATKHNVRWGDLSGEDS